MRRLLIVPIIILFSVVALAQQPPVIKKSPGGPLPGTVHLDWDGDIVEKLTDAADAFFLAETLETVKRQESFWNRDLSSALAYEKSLETNRRELARILGVVEPRVEFPSPQFVHHVGRSPELHETDDYAVYAIRWPVFGDYIAEGLFVMPKREKPSRIDILIPDAGEYAEDFVTRICENPW